MNDKAVVRVRDVMKPGFDMIDGKMTMPFGTPGGDVQCQAMLQVFPQA